MAGEVPVPSVILRDHILAGLLCSCYVDPYLYRCPSPSGRVSARKQGQHSLARPAKLRVTLRNNTWVPQFRGPRKFLLRRA